MLSFRNLPHNLTRLASIFSRAHIAQRVNIVEQVMRNFRALVPRWLGCANLKIAVHRHRVTIDNLTPEAARKC